MEINKEKKRITIRDIARDTGLSVATVSRVVNKVNRHYSPDTEKKAAENLKIIKI